MFGIINEEENVVIGGDLLRRAVISGAHSITNKKKSVDELNVFPVPDGDTGSNMSMTINNSVAELENLPEDVPCGTVAQTAASALLRGARGNSGVILSLIFRGFSKGLAGKTEMTAEDLVNSLELGVQGAYKSVMKPTEGTILTVAREAAEKARESLRSTNDPGAVMADICAQAKITLDKTPELLPALAKAAREESTLLFHEAPHKLLNTLNDMLEYFGDRRISLCRELTKVHEEVMRTTISQAIEYYKENKPRGEYVLVVEGCRNEHSETEVVTIEDALLQVEALVQNGMRAADACKEIAKVTPFSKGELYAARLDNK